MFDEIGMMEDEQKERKEKRQIVALGVCMAVLTLAMLFGGGEDELSAGEMGMPEQAAYPAAEQEKADAPKRILGAAKAAKSSALADPFSLLHPTRKEMEQAASAAPPVEAAPMASETAAVPVISEEPMKSAELPVFELKGIAKGGGGGIAILKHGGMTHSLQAGESLGDVRVEEIADNYVLLSNGMRLELRMP